MSRRNQSLCCPTRSSRSPAREETLQMSGRFHAPVDMLLLHLLSHHVTPSRALCSISYLSSPCLSCLSSLLSHPDSPPPFLHRRGSHCLPPLLLHLTQSPRATRVNNTNFNPSGSGQWGHGRGWNCICQIMSACTSKHVKIMVQRRELEFATHSICTFMFRRRRKMLLAFPTCQIKVDGNPAQIWLRQVETVSREKLQNPLETHCYWNVLPALSKILNSVFYIWLPSANARAYPFHFS